MSVWEKHDIEVKIREILSDVTYRSKPDHHFGIPFLTTYQISIELNKRYPEIAAEFGYKVGGQGTNSQNSLSQYIGRQLSGYINSGKITDIEGAFLSNNNLENIEFNNDGEKLVSSLTKTQFDISMFRLVK